MASSRVIILSTTIQAEDEDEDGGRGRGVAVLPGICDSLGLFGWKKLEGGARG